MIWKSLQAKAFAVIYNALCARDHTDKQKTKAHIQMHSSLVAEFTNHGYKRNSLEAED